jgi:hypothetical protein
VATINAQFSLANSGIISGIGLAIANMIESLFIVFTILPLSTQGADTHIKISTQIIASLNFQSILRIFVIFNISIFSLFKSVLLFETIHLLSQTIISLNQYNFANLIIAVPAAPSQFTTILQFSLFLLVIFKLFINHARQTMAVQC